MKFTTTKIRLLALISVITSIFIMASCTSSNKNNDLNDNDWDEYNLFGKVKSFRKTTYEAEEKFGEIEKGVESVLFGSEQVVFNLNGNKVEKNRYYSYNLLRKEKYKYDEKGNKIEKSRYDADGILDDKYTFKYDKKGNKMEESNYDADGIFLYKTLYKYDKKGNKIEESNYDADASLQYKIIYDEKGNIIENIFYRSGLEKRTVYIYEYEFDNKGNWINKITFINNIPTEITEREIEYF